MAVENKWNLVPPQLFTANGTQFGQVTLANTAGFFTKQSAYLTATGLPTLPVQIKRVISPTILIVGTINNAQIGSWPPLDISAYTVANGAAIGAQIQPKNNAAMDDIMKAVYESDPTVALRVVFTDQYGNLYSDQNPLPATFTGTITIGTVEITGPSGHLLDPNADGSLNVDILPGGQVEVIGSNGNILEPNPDGSQDVLNLAQLVPFEFNEIDLTNSVIDGQTVPTVVVYKQASVTVATLTLTYDGSANLLSVVRT
jgi:hypothetical protein